MVIELIVSLIPKFDLLEVHLDSDITHVYVLQTQILLQTVRALVCYVPKRIEKLLGPVLEEGDLGQECLAQICEELLQRLALFDLKKVLVVVGIRHVIEAEVARTVL